MTSAAAASSSTPPAPPPPQRPPPPPKLLLRRRIFRSRNLATAAAIVLCAASMSTYGNLLSRASRALSSSVGSASHSSSMPPPKPNPSGGVEEDAVLLPPSDAGRAGTTTNDAPDADDGRDDFRNSDAWMNGLRFGNADPGAGGDASTMERVVLDQIISNPFRKLESSDGGGTVRPVLDRTLCDARSRFVTNDAPWTTTAANAIDGGGRGVVRKTETAEDDAFTLLYLAMHENQNGPARDEARARLKRPPPPPRQSKNAASPFAAVGPYDYECRNAKFVVAHFPGMGMGGAFRFGVVDTLVSGLVLGRVGLILNGLVDHWGAKSVSKFVNHPHRGGGLHQWMAGRLPSASCDRGDLQCFFLPLSPCVITEEELRKAPILNRTEWRAMHAGKMPERYKDERVVVTLPPTHPPPLPSNQIVHDAVRRIANWTSNDENVRGRHGGEALDLVRRENALRFIREEMPKDWIGHVAPFYALRPNRKYRAKIDEAISRMFPPDFRPDDALGLPVRSSDKCFGESECLTFDQYMRLAKSVSDKAATKGNATLNTLILTSESLSFVQNKRRYENNSTFPFRFVTNDDDVSQGTGNPGDYKKLLKLNVTADDIMLSSVTAIRMQLMAGRTVGNCCSNFHRLMKELLIHGCGAAHRNDFECMQENDNPEFRLCCKWTNTAECKTKQKEGMYGKDFEKGTDYLRDGAEGKKRRGRRQRRRR